jgi:Protein of unknown function (DUF1592)/Protein of unknown function (DUF1588)/Protein of unknown function (DUF1587)/Protein of unknown function (DUF1585)/Protein of unknown function (DUF1595)/Planctomycete cytochrome C
MRVRFTLAALCAALLCAGAQAEAPAAAAHAPAFKGDWHMLQTYCMKCHNSEDWAGGVAFDTMSATAAGDDAKIWEEAIMKLRGGLMPPPGKPQPDLAARAAFAQAAETFLDQYGALHPDPGHMVLHRLNRNEYANAIQDLLGVEVDPNALLPRDDKSGNFDNIAEVLKVSPTFLDQYFSAARQVTVAAIGSPHARTQDIFFNGPPEPQEYQYMHVDGLPLGTRGGMLFSHNFPADGEYRFTINGLVGAGYLWGELDPNTLIITVDGKRAFENKLGGEQDLDAVDLQQAAGLTLINDRFKNVPVHISAGEHRIGITFVQTSAAETNEILHAFVPVAGMGQPVNGNSNGPRLANVEIKGPTLAQGVSDTASRRRIFTCYPKSAAQETPCAHEIFATIARRAFRRPLTDADLKGAMDFYAQGRKEGGDFDSGIQKGLLAILVSPKFLFRMHEPPPGAVPGKPFAISDIDLASRLSFFLWAGPPDDELIKIAAGGTLHEPAVLDGQVRRLLKDPRAHSLVTDFAFEWLNVHGLELVDPDTNLFPDYTADLETAFEKEIELFVGSVFDSDSSVMDLLTSNRTYLNERLALHYHLPNVRGGEFRAVTVPDYRRGLLGKGAVLMTTSYANRTSVVLRGAYVLDKFLGTPPQAPPPGVPAFAESQEGTDQLTVRARMEAHRAQPSCNACHAIIDPIGLALENFNALGQWRDKDIDAGTPIDAKGKLADGTPVNGVDDLRNHMVAHAPQFMETFTANLMSYGLGRGLDYYDMPTVRAIVRDTAKDHYRFSAIVLGIVNSEAFREDQIPLKAPGEPPASLSHTAAKL